MNPFKNIFKTFNKNQGQPINKVQPQATTISNEIGSLVTLLALLIVLSVFILFYTRMRIEVSLLDRKIRQAQAARIEQERKNSSLRSELARKKGENAILTYWKLYGALPDYGANRVIRVRIPD